MSAQCYSIYGIFAVLLIARITEIQVQWVFLSSFFAKATKDTPDSDVDVDFTIVFLILNEKGNLLDGEPALAGLKIKSVGIYANADRNGE